MIIEQIQGNPGLKALASTPFFCRLLVEELGQPGLEGPLPISSATRLMATSVRRMVLREFDKGLLSRHWAGPEEIESLIQDIAEENLEAGSKGVRVEEVADVALYSLPTDMDAEELAAAVEQIKQLPFFTSSTDMGRLSFAQEVIYDYLLGVRASKYFGSNPRRFQQLLGFRPLSKDSATVRVLVEAITADSAFNDLLRQAQSAAGDPIAFRNVLQVILSTPEASWIVSKLALERQDLSGLVMNGLDLKSVSFRGANLEATQFVECKLGSATFAEAVLNSTRFEECSGIATADFGDMSSFFSAVVDKQRVEDTQVFMQMTGVGGTGSANRAVRACDAANQLRFLFSKFIRPDGGPRRDWLDEKALLSGKRYTDPGSVLTAAVRHGFVYPDPGRARFVRSRGDDYSQMVGLVSKLQLSAKIRGLLAEVCRQPGCHHVLEVGPHNH